MLPQTIAHQRADLSLHVLCCKHGLIWDTELEEVLRNKDQFVRRTGGTSASSGLCGLNVHLGGCGRFVGQRNFRLRTGLYVSDSKRIIPRAH